VKTGPILPSIQSVVNIYNMNHFPTAVSEEATLNAILHSQRTGDSGDPLARPLDELTLQAYETRYGKLDPEARVRPPLSVRDFLQPHPQGIEPLRLADLFVSMAEDALTGVQSAQGCATREKEELARFENDSYSILLLARFHRAKLDAGTMSGQVNGAPVHLRELARNILRWGQESVVSEKTVGEN